MNNGWYILNYHNISWEENYYTRGLANNFPPDIFTKHIEFLNGVGKLVSVEEGLKKTRSNNINEPLISIWFDDGFNGVKNYAYPIMEDYGIKGAVSVCSKFFLMEEFFWRSKLMFISQMDGLRFLRSKMKKFGYKNDMRLKRFVLDNFSLEIINVIDSVYNDFTSEIDRKDAFRNFMTKDDVIFLLKNGWEIGNHTASHYPVFEKSGSFLFQKEFEECEKQLLKSLGIKTSYWVSPFDRVSAKIKRNEYKTLIKYAIDKGKCFVLVGNRYNSYNNWNNIIYRIATPIFKNNLAFSRYLNHIKSS